MHIAVLKQVRAERHPLRAVVVAGNHEDGNAKLVEPHEESVQKLYRLNDGCGFIIDIACYQNGIGLMLFGKRNDFREDVRLVINHRKLVYALAEVQVG